MNGNLFFIEHTGEPYGSLVEGSLPLSEFTRLRTATFPLNGQPHCFTSRDIATGTALYNFLCGEDGGFVTGTLLKYGPEPLSGDSYSAVACTGLCDTDGLTYRDGRWNLRPEAFETRSDIVLPDSGYVIPPSYAEDPVEMYSPSGFPRATTSHRHIAEEVLGKLFPHRLFAGRELSYWVRGKPGEISAVVVSAGGRKSPWYLLGDRPLDCRNGWVGSLRVRDKKKN